MNSNSHLQFKIILLISCVFILGCVGSGLNVGAMKMLIKLGKNDKLKTQLVNQETENYNKLKDYILSEKLKSGLSADSAVNLFGEPILVLPFSKKAQPEQFGEKKWAYKPSNANWIGGEKIYLYFSEQGNLLDWECINCK